MEKNLFAQELHGVVQEYQTGTRSFPEALDKVHAKAEDHVMRGGGRYAFH